MPDPKLALPVRVELRLGKHVVVDANGRRLPESGSYDDAGAAGSVASSINDAWKAARSGRRKKGAPEVTEARRGRLHEALAEFDADMRQ